MFHPFAQAWKTNTHGPGENFMNTGFTLDGFPSIGAWTTYALGSVNENLPAYVAIPDPARRAAIRVYELLEIPVFFPRPSRARISTPSSR